MADEMRLVGHLRPIPTALCMLCPSMARIIAQTETEMPDSIPRLARARWVNQLASPPTPTDLAMGTEKLYALLKDEKENAEGFEPLPRRFLETSKVLLDV